MKGNRTSHPISGKYTTNPLQQARIKAKVSQEEAAKALSCTLRTIQRYEAGTLFPKQDVLMRMKVCYSCRIADLFPDV